MKFKTLWHILFIFIVLQLTGDAWSKTCFMTVFYDNMFAPTTLQSEPTDNTILVAESDILTATGKVAGCKGCLDHVNNNRFDLLLRNSAVEGPDQVPLSLRMQQIRIGFEDLNGNVSSQWIQIGKQQISTAFDTPISFKKSRPFNSPKGFSENPEFLEPGEGIIGCVSLSQKDRRKKGKALIEVRYEPLVWMHDLSENMQTEPVENKMHWRAQHKIHDLEKNGFRIYKFTMPNETQDPSDIRISLDNAQGLEIYKRRADHGWSQNIHDWQAGELTSSGDYAGETIFILVRSVRETASGTLKAEYMTGEESTRDAESVMVEKDGDGFAPTPVGPPSTRIFKAFALGTGGSEDDGKSLTYSSAKLD